MEFPFNVKDVFPGENSICVVRPSLNVIELDPSKDLSNICIAKSRAVPTNTGKDYQNRKLLDVIDKLGEASAKAQGLQSPITTSQKLQGSDHNLYIKIDSSIRNGCIVGILKVGHKRLFVIDKYGTLHESEPLCILDFYVHESQQRKGYGKELFQAMLKVENILPQHLAIDRPSSKFVAFLQKHYNLTDIINQANNFVVFNEFFNENLAFDIKSQKRHSFAGLDYYRSPANASARPHSLGIESCFDWNGTSPNETGGCTSNDCSRSSYRSEPSSASRDDSFKQNRLSSSSWNVFGVPPPDYRNGEDNSPMYKEAKKCNVSNR